MNTLSNFISESLKYPKTFTLYDDITIVFNDNWDRNTFSDLLNKAKNSKNITLSHREFVDKDNTPYTVKFDGDNYIINGVKINSKQIDNFLKQLYL